MQIEQAPTGRKGYGRGVRGSFRLINWLAELASYTRGTDVVAFRTQQRA